MSVRLPEDRFTPSSEACPRPEDWTSADGDSTEWEVSELVGGFVRGLQPRYCVETGTAFGQTARAIGLALAANERGVLHTIENDPERARVAAARLDGLPVVLHVTDSLTFDPSETIDLAFFDSHYEHRVPEFRRYRPHMRVGTVALFHDTAPGHGAHRIPSGNDLRTEIELELGYCLELAHLPTPRGLTVGVIQG